VQQDCLLINDRPPANECVYLVKHGHFRQSHYSAHRGRKPHAARKLYGSIFYRTGLLLPIEVLHCGNRNFRTVWLLWLILTLTRWPSCTNLTRIPWRCIGWTKMNVLYIKVFEGYRLTDRQTDSHIEIIYHVTPLRGWSEITEIRQDLTELVNIDSFFRGPQCNIQHVWYVHTTTFSN